MEGECVGRGTRFDQKRADIVEAAESQFLEHGYGAASMDRIAALAGASKRTVYNHFASKEELFRAVVARLYGETLNSPDTTPPPGMPVEAALEVIAWRILAHIGNERVLSMIRLVMAECQRFPEVARIYSASGKDPGISRIADWVRMEAGAGRLAVTNPHLAAEQFLGCLKEALVWPMFLGQTPTTPRELVVREAIKMFLARYAPDKEPM